MQLLDGAGVQPPVNDSKQSSPPNTHNTDTCNLATSHQPGFVHKPAIRSATLFGDMERLPIFEEDDEDEEDAGSTSAAYLLAQTDSGISPTGREQHSNSRRSVPAATMASSLPEWLQRYVRVSTKVIISS